MLAGMQATVSSYDAATRAGAVLLDDGRLVVFEADAVASGVRLLRPGQRVRLDVDVTTERVTRVQLLTLP
jgi:cold shock CspA family protein